MDSTPLIDTPPLPLPIPRFVLIVDTPIFILFLMPFVLILIAAIYIVATLEGTRMAFQAATGTTPESELELPKPHF